LEAAGLADLHPPAADVLEDLEPGLLDEGPVCRARRQHRLRAVRLYFEK
jgi:hypothetical protein